MTHEFFLLWVPRQSGSALTLQCLVLQAIFFNVPDTKLSHGYLGVPIETIYALATSLCEKLGLTVQQGKFRFPQVVHHLANLCVS